MAKKTSVQKNSPKQMDPPPGRSGDSGGSAMSMSVGLIVGVLVGLLLGILVLFYLTLIRVDEQDGGSEIVPMNDFIDRPVIIQQ